MSIFNDGDWWNEAVEILECHSIPSIYRKLVQLKTAFVLEDRQE